MKKKILSVALAAVLVLSLTLAGCGSSDGGEKQGGNGKLVGVAMPTQSSERWIKDGRNMKAQLEALGYEVFLQYAEDDVQVQLAQIETMMRSAAIAFSKQLDGLYGNDALDISAEIAAMETMLAKEGLTGQELKAGPVQTDSTDIRLEL